MFLCSHLNSCWSGSKWDAHFIFIKDNPIKSKSFRWKYCWPICQFVLPRQLLVLSRPRWSAHSCSFALLVSHKDKDKASDEEKDKHRQLIVNIGRGVRRTVLFCVFGKSQRQRQRLSLRQKIRQRQRQTQPAVFSALVKLECTQWLFCTFGNSLRTLQTHFR